MYNKILRQEIAKLKQLYINRYQFETSDNIKIDFALSEIITMQDGLCAIYDSFEYGLIICRAIGTVLGNSSEYVKYQISSDNGVVNQEIDAANDDIFIVKNNWEGTPAIPDIMTYAEEMANVRIAIFQQVNNMKRPYIIRANKKMSGKIISEMNSHNSVAPVIVDPDVMSPDMPSVKIDQTPTIDNLQSLRMIYDEICSDAVQSIGYLSQVARKPNERLTKNESATGVDIITAIEAYGYGNRLKLLEWLKPRVPGAIKLRKCTYVNSSRDKDGDGVVDNE